MTSHPSPEDSLRGRRIAITRTSDQATTLIERLQAYHADPVVYSTIQIVPPADYDAVDTALHSIAQYQWILFTSVNGVTAFMDRCAALDIPRHLFKHISIGAVGTTTADAVIHAGLTPIVVPKPFVARALIDALGAKVIGKRILLPRANIAKSDLPMELRRNGAIVDEVVVYRTEPGPGITDLLSETRAGTLDAITFASSSAVRYFIDGAHAYGAPAEGASAHGASAYGTHTSITPVDDARPSANDSAWLERLWLSDRRPAIFCIGPVTAATAHAFGVPVDAVAEEHDADGLLTAIVDWFAVRYSHP